jgi:hypothetical protein
LMTAVSGGLSVGAALFSAERASMQFGILTMVMAVRLL